MNCDFILLIKLLFFLKKTNDISNHIFYKKFNKFQPRTHKNAQEPNELFDDSQSFHFKLNGTSAKNLGKKLCERRTAMIH